MDTPLPPELLKAIDPVPFGKYAMQEEQGHFTEHGYISLSGDEWVHERLSLIHILIDEIAFCGSFLHQHPMKCVRGRLFTVDGMIEDEGKIQQMILDCLLYTSRSAQPHKSSARKHPPDRMCRLLPF